MPISEKAGSLIHGRARTEKVKRVKEKPESTILVSRVECKAHRKKFADGKWRDVYRFTVSGREECEIIGLREAKRVINGRFDPAARCVHGIEH